MSGRKKSAASLRESGSRHYTKDTLAKREKAEVKAPPADEPPIPSYLPASLRPKFTDIAGTMIRMGVMSTLDGDALARYLISEHNYLRATNRLTAALNAGDADAAGRWSAVQDRFFKQCRALANDMGLTAASRCVLKRLSVDVDDASPDELFGC